MPSLRLIVLLLVISICSPVGLQADVISYDFSLGTGGDPAVGNPVELSRMFTASDGVSFTATLNVVGSADIQQTETVLGIVGNSSNLFNGDEFAEFSIGLSAISGGTVVFDGFTAIDLDSFENGASGVTTDNERAAISSDSIFDSGDQILTAETTPDIFTLADLNSFFLVADGNVDHRFRARDVTARFTTTAAVPEPSTWAMTGLLLSGFAWRRRQLSSSVRSL